MLRFGFRRRFCRMRLGAGWRRWCSRRGGSSECAGHGGDGDIVRRRRLGLRLRSCGRRLGDGCRGAGSTPDGRRRRSSRRRGFGYRGLQCSHWLFAEVNFEINWRAMDVVGDRRLGRRRVGNYIGNDRSRLGSRFDQGSIAVEDQRAGAATNNAPAQFQLVSRDPEDRIAMGAFSGERHQSGSDLMPACRTGTPSLRAQPRRSA